MIALVRFCFRLVSIAMIGIFFFGGELRAQAGAPTVVITPPSGEYTAGQQVAITVEYCDNNGLDTATAVVEFNGAPKNWPKQYVIGNPGPCQWKLTRTGTVTMLAGSNSMRASIEDTSPMPLWSGWTTNFWTTPVPPAGVTIVRDNQYLESTPATLSTLSFVVTNTGTVQDTFTVSAVNSGLDSIGTPVAAPLSPKGKFILATGATGTVTIVVKSPSAQLATGRATLTVTGHASASTWTEITSSVAPVGPTGVVLLNPTGIVDKSLCLTIAAGPAAAAECGDLRMAYALPGVVTKNKARVPTLLYSTQAARPTVTIPAELTVTSPTLGVQYTASVQITSGPESGQTFAAGTWSSNDWAPGGRRRILATFDGAGLSTGRKTYILTIQLNGGATYTATGELLHVNRIASPFTAGWWLAGLEQLVSYDTSSTAQEKMLWVGGDGSARVYRETAINSCVFTHDPLDRPDSIVGTLSPTGCMARERRSSNGLRVLFDAAGNHVQTINRLGETTSFTYLNGALATIVLPSGTLSRQYDFAYTGGILDSIVAPGNPVGRVIRISRNTGAAVAGTARSRIVAILGLDADSVRFGYEGGSGNGVGGYRATSRTDRMGIATTFTYDAAYRLASASTPASATQTVTQTLRAAEGQGIATALVLDSVYTRLDGPRTNATDVSKWWLNRLGAPVRTRNAVGMESRIVYDATWPALPARVSDAAGLTTTATYTSRGLVWQTTVIGPLGATGGNAVSTMTWHPVWDMPTSIVDPNGVTTTRTYDAANGNLLTEYVGNSALRATTYEYDATTKQLARIFTPASGVADRIYYDLELGNVSKTKSPRGNVIAHYKDRLGRDTLVVSSVDAVTDTVTKVQRTVLHYDAAGRAWETITSSPAMPYTLEHNWQLTDPTPVTADTQFVRTTFDKEGRALTINSFSRPNLGVWEQCDAPVGVCLGVPEGTEGSFDIRTYDWIGRPLTQRLGSGPKQVTYDPAGNVTSSLTRNNHTITSTYDAANRLAERIVPSVTYAQEYCQYYPAGMRSGTGGCMMVFPFYPTGAGTSLVLPADTSRFVFDAAGRMIRADNKDARIIRTYFPGGALSSETQQIRSYGTSSFSATTFTQSYTYDIGGRRVSHVLPGNLGDGTVTYEYDAERGFLKHVVHGLDRFSFTLDAAGRQDSLVFARNISGSYVTGVVELRSYDPDGNVAGTSRLRWDGTAFVPLLQSTLTLDARGRMRSVSIESAAPEVGAQQVRINYAGSGPVVSSERWNTLGHDTEQFRTTALGEVWRSRTDVGSQSAKYPVISSFDINGALKQRGPVRPGLDPLAESYYSDTTATMYDLAGNTIRTSSIFNRFQDQGDRYYIATRTYYSADNRVAVSQRYHTTDAANTGAWEEYRYDALGRRVLTRSRRGTLGSVQFTLCSGGATICPYNIERTVWDGDQVLYELRANGHDTLTNAQLDNLTSVGLAWGKAGYVHAGGIDKPLMTMDGRVPNYNWRGLPESSVWTTGARADCSLQGTGTCTTIAWPSQNSIYMKPYPYAVGGSNPPQWVGSVLADGAGSTGLLYRRNRYYDPSTGQFTQQDPIGIAGGANVYGFAGGDPVNFSDPFGLCTQADGWKDCDKMITAMQGMQILAHAIESGEWTYSQFPSGRRMDPSSAQPGQRLGDCTDFCRSSVRGALGSDWSSSRKASTAMFRAGNHPGFTEVESGSAQAGDVVVQGGHAGIYIGRDQGGNVWGWANNGSPTRKDGSGYRDKTTGARKFNAGSFGRGDPRFFRPIIQ